MFQTFVWCFLIFLRVNLLRSDLQHCTLLTNIFNFLTYLRFPSNPLLWHIKNGSSSLIKIRCNNAKPSFIVLPVIVLKLFSCQASWHGPIYSHSILPLFHYSNLFIMFSHLFHYLTSYPLPNFLLYHLSTLLLAYYT